MQDAEPLGRAGIGLDTSAEDLERLLAADAVAELGPDDLLVISELAHRRGRDDLAIRAMMLLLRSDEREPRWQLRLAQLLLAVENWEAAARHCEAARALAPGDEEAHRLLIHIRNGCGDLEGALEAAEALRRHCNDGRTMGLQVGEILARLGRVEEALIEVRRINDFGPPSESSLLLEAELDFRAGRLDAAIVAAERACRLWPGSADAHLKSSVLLCEARQYERAAPRLARTRALCPGSAQAAYLHGVALRALGRDQEAWDAVGDALRLEPRECEYLYLAALLCESGCRRAEALAYLEQAIAVCPDRIGLYVAKAHISNNDGQPDVAMGALEVARKLDPANQEIRDFKLALLAQTDRPTGRRVFGSALPLPLPRAAISRGKQRSPIGLLDRLRAQMRVLIALVRREFRYRALHSRFGILSVMIPQAIQIATLGVVLGLFNNGRPPIGDHLFFFYATGVMPFYLFIHIMDHAQNHFLDNVSLLQLPTVTRLDCFLAMALAELLINGATIVVTFGTFALISYGSESDNQIEAVAATLAVWLFALGLGLISAVMNNLFRPWAGAWLVLQRFLYIASGVFYIPDVMPDWIRRVLVWNPILQGIEWFRTGFFIGYDPPWLDKPYLIGLGFATILIGLMLERALRGKMKTQ